MLASPDVHLQSFERQPEPFCECWRNKGTPISWEQLDCCSCGEVSGAVCEWVWDAPALGANSWLVLSADKRQVTFHPVFSSGTAAIKGDSPFLLNMHYYWEVKILTETYGTDIMVGVGSGNVNISTQFEFTSLLGSTGESYGLSYTGALRHNELTVHESGGFCRGSVVGVRVDMWRGTLEFYLNRVPQGIAFYNLRRHASLFPMISSTAAQSSFRLLHAGSWRGSLLVDALKILAAASTHADLKLPPGLAFTSTTQFWLSLPTDGKVTDAHKKLVAPCATVEAVRSQYSPMEVLPSQFINGYYVDNVDPNYRLVLYSVEEIGI